jgi:RNA polymerase sigma factor (sigma-70 family)
MATAPTFLHSLHQLTAAHVAAELSDRQLLERYAGRGDEAAFAALVRRHGPLVLGVCRRLLRDGHAAEDAFQATFLVLARRAGSVARPEALGPWLHGVAARVALKARAQAARRRAGERQAAARAPTATAPEDLGWRDLRPVLDEAVSALPEKLRVPFVLHYLEGRTVTAVARQLGCPRGTVATHLARARQRLRAWLVRRGVTLSAAALAAVLARNLAARAAAPLLPGPLVKAAASLTAAGSAPAAVAALAQGGLQTMSLRRSLVLALALLLALGAVGGGTVLLAQALPAQGPAGPQQAAAPAAETELSLFREGGKRFLAEDYPGAHRAFVRLVWEYPDGALAAQASYLATIAKHADVAAAEARSDRSRVTEARRIIDAVLAGAAAAGQPSARPRNDQTTRGVRSRPQAAELLRQFHACYKEGKYQEAERYARAALEIDPDNAAARAAVEIAGVQRRQHDPIARIFREMNAGYAAELGERDANLEKVQEAWLERLAEFVQTYPQAEDAPEALLQLGMLSEFLNREIEARKWYRQLAANFPDRPAARKALGAIRRLELDGKVLELSGPTLAGGRYDISQARGKVVVVYYWASWNQQCVGDVARLKRLLDANAGTLELVTVNLDTTASEATDFLRRAPAPGTHLHQDGGLDSPPALQYGIVDLPTLFLVGKDGKVVSRTAQVNTLEDALKRQLPVVAAPVAGRGKLVIKTYRVGKWVGRDATGEALLRLITRAVEPATWDVRGGPGTIDYHPLTRALVVYQTPDVQEQVEDFLASLQALAEDWAGKEGN